MSSFAVPPVQYLFISVFSNEGFGSVSQVQAREATSKPQWVCCGDERLGSHRGKRRESLASGITAMSHFVMQHAANILMCTEM